MVLDLKKKKASSSTPARELAELGMDMGMATTTLDKRKVKMEVYRMCSLYRICPIEFVLCQPPPWERGW
jgi:hypothetical protein